MAHEVREHGVMRLTRKKVVDRVCPICCKLFGSRGQCLDHIEKQKSQICMVNLTLFHSDFDEGVLEEADRLQAVLAAKTLKQGEWHGYTGTLVLQMRGHLPRFLIPLEHSRKSRYKLFQRYLKDRTAAVEVDFEDILKNLHSDLEAARGNIPLTWICGGS